MRRRMQVPLARLAAQHERLREELQAAFDRVLSTGAFVLGAEVEAFEQEFAQYCETQEAVAVNSGTDALILALRALGIGPGDEVIVPALTFAATAEAVCWIGARPLVLDVEEETLTLDPAAVERALAERAVRAIVPVHLYGHPAALEPICRLARSAGVPVVEDAAQAHGARTNGKRVGSWGTLAAFSFYPTKNLGALGDGGAVTTDAPELAAALRRLRDHGQEGKYRHVTLGTNSRLDALQAAFLRAKLRWLETWNQRRRELAERYRCQLADSTAVRPLTVRSEAEPVYHQFVVRCPRREALAGYLGERGIQTAVHYPVPIHLQPAFAFLRQGPGTCPVAEQACQEVLALPLYPELEEREVEFVCAAVRQWKE